MYRKVDTRIWNDEKFCSLTDDGKLVFLMLLTHHNMTQLGAMKASIAGLAEELGWDLKRFQKAFAPAVSSGMVEHDPHACLIYLPNFIKYNKPLSPNVVKAWVKASVLLPECDMRVMVMETAKAFLEGLSEGYQQAFIEEFSKAYPCPSPNQKQKQKQKEKNPGQAGINVGTTTPSGTAV